MTTSTRSTYPKFKALHPTTNLPLSDGLLYTYTRGTTTAKTTYSNIGKTTANANPVVLDSAGEATIFLDGSYKFVLKDSAGTTIWTQDDINVAESTTALASDSAFGLVTNGSFEDDTDGDGDPDGWTVTETGTVALDATDANHASQCLKFTSTGSGGGYITSSSFMEVSANNSYSIIFSVKSSVADIRNLVTVSWYDLDQVIIAGSPVTVWDDSATNPTSWTEKRFSVTPAAGACFAKLTFHGCHSSDATSGNTKYDYVRMFDERMDSVKVDSDGAVVWLGKDSANNDQTYAKIYTTVSDSTSGSEDSIVTVQTAVAGTVADRVIIGQGMQIGAPTGGDKGAGTINITGEIYKNGTIYGKLAQYVEATPITTHITGTSLIPPDDTVPQNTEGDEIITCTITPESATNRLVIIATIPSVWCSLADVIGGAIFQDSTAAALTASGMSMSASTTAPMIIRHEMAAGTTSATTFKLRMGAGSTANNMRLNGTNASRLYGGSQAIRMRIEEYR